MLRPVWFIMPQTVWQVKLATNCWDQNLSKNNSMAKAKSSSSDQTWLIWSIAHCPTSIWASKFLFLYSNLWGRFVLGEQVLDKRVAIRELSLCRCTLCGQHLSLLEVQKNLDELRDRRSKIGHFAARVWKVKSHYIISGRVKEDPSGTAFLLNPPDHCWHNRLLGIFGREI